MKTERCELRLTSREKQQLTRLAKLNGLTLTGMVGKLIAGAVNVEVTLSVEDFEDRLGMVGLTQQLGLAVSKLDRAERDIRVEALATFFATKDPDYLKWYMVEYRRTCDGGCVWSTSKDSNNGKVSQGDLDLLTMLDILDGDMALVDVEAWIANKKPTEATR